MSEPAGFYEVRRIVGPVERVRHVLSGKCWCSRCFLARCRHAVRLHWTFVVPIAPGPHAVARDPDLPGPIRPL